jgi:DNA polymerase (family X)
MLGHPTGRLLLAREGYELDLDAVIDAAATAGTLIEINANPHRLDLDAVYSRRAAQKGVRIVINPDAHSVGGLDDLQYGVSVARRAWLTKAEVWNTGSLAAMEQRVADAAKRAR